MLEEILAGVGADSFRIFISGDRNFRKELYPAYKANRDGKPRPKWLTTCKEYLVKEWNGEVTDGYEADDALGIAGSEGDGRVIATIDKDLKQVPGDHFNFVTKQFTHVSVEAGLRTFYTQLLVGDPTDNIGGCPGIGKVKSSRLLDGCETEDEMFDAVREAYKNDKLMRLYGQLLWIWRKPNDIWNHGRFDLTINTKQDQDQQ